MNTHLAISRFLNKEEAAAAAGEALNDLLAQNKNQPVLLLLSGGSAFNLLDYISPSSLGENLTISVLDERFSEEADVNNFAQLEKIEFFTDALEACANFFGTLPRNGESMEDFAKRWEASLKKWRDDFPKGKIIATLGMGADGHITGIFPFPEDASKFQQLFESGKWIASYDAGSKNKFKKRVTATITFLRLIDEAIIFACGKEKKEKFDMVLSKTSALAQLPAMAWHELKRARIFTDIVLRQ